MPKFFKSKPLPFSIIDKSIINLIVLKRTVIIENDSHSEWAAPFVVVHSCYHICEDIIVIVKWTLDTHYQIPVAT